MAARDPYQFINDADEATVQRLIERMEFRGQDPIFSRLRDAYFDCLPLATADPILVLGCGPGVNARALAARLDVAGRIIGIDQSPAMIDAAARAATEAGVTARLTFEVGDAHDLAHPDGAFALAIVHTVLSHVREPLTVLRELARVTRPGGMIALFDGDYASWTWAAADAALGRAMDEGFATGVISHSRIMRELPRLLRQADLVITEAFPFVYAEIGAGRFFLAGAETYGPLLAHMGLVSATQVERWLVDQREASSQGTFFAACNYYAYIAQRP